MFKILEHQVSFLILDRPTFSDHMLIISKKKVFWKDETICYAIMQTLNIGNTWNSMKKNSSNKRSLNSLTF